MFYYVLSGLIISIVLLTSGYFYVNYTFNKLDQEIEIPTRKEKPIIKSNQRKYMQPKAAAITYDSITNEPLMFYELMMNLDWENISVPKIEENEIATQTMRCFYNRIIESTGILNENIYVHNPDHVNTFKTLFSEFNLKTGDEITHRFCREHKTLIGYEYTIDSSVEINFFSTEDQLKAEYISPQRNVAEQKIEFESTGLKSCSICPKEEIIIYPPYLFCTTLYDLDTGLEKVLTSFNVSSKSNRLYKLVGVCVWSQNQFVFSAVLINEDYYCRNISMNNLSEEYTVMNLNKNLAHIVAQKLPNTVVHLVYARDIF